MASAFAVRSSASAEDSDPLADPELDDLDPVTADIARFALGSATVYPILPATVSDILALANRTDAPFREVDRCVRHDPVLAARVLSVANSPLYRPPGPITSLRVALLRLGWTNLRSILLQAIAEAHVFPRGPRREFSSARAHAVAVAHIHRQLAQTLGLDGEHAFACGLLHDLGRPMLFALLGTKGAPAVDRDVKHVIVDRLHCHVGERVARGWQLPDVVVRVCRGHHEEPSEGSISHIGTTTIAVSEFLAERSGFGSAPPVTPLSGDVLLERLDMDPVVIADLVARAGELCRELG